VIAERARFAIVAAMNSRTGIATADFIRKRYPEGEQNRALTHIAWGVAQKDPNSVIQWAQRNADPQLRRAMIEQVLVVICPKMAGENSHGWPPSDANSDAPDALRLGDLWISESVAAAEPLRGAEKVFTATVEQSGITSAFRFLDRVSEQFPEATKRVIGELANTRGWSFVSDAALQLPPGPRRAEWLKEAVTGLAATGDQAVARALTERLPVSEREPVVRALAVAMFREDPDASAQMLLDLPQGHGDLKSELGQWLERNPRAARRWIGATATLTPEDKQELLTPAL
jgi:hypothetical protein